MSPAVASPARHDVILRIRGLRTHFPAEQRVIRAVDGVDLDVRRGECLGVVGESGSGKTVTFLSALGLVAPPGIVTAEHIVWEGREIGALPRAALRALRGREIALTMQDALTALNPALTIGTQITEALAAHADARAAGPRRDRAEELLRLVGIPDPRRRLRAYPHELSGGMRQRAMIAVALACGPRLLIADEPTTALDVTVQAQVLDLLAELRQTLRMSLVLITHNLAVVAERCDRVSVMYAGQVVETGPAARVIAAPRHPYTAGLLASVPDLDRPAEALRPIPGRTPDPAHWPEGCRFAERCPARMPECAAPQRMRRLADGEVRCRLADAA
ncbi:MAG: ABC transporter ATP-binding protein [Acidisphaera sp.]|nr:ABC transporter ATP-binding protein [Acidisphaera sp.]